MEGLKKCGRDVEGLRRFGGDIVVMVWEDWEGAPMV